MTTFLYRTEDIRLDEIKEYFVETQQDRSAINALKSVNPVVLVGSRGVGKSFLLRIAESELGSSFEIEKIFPVYVTFNRSSLIHTSDPAQFQHWMLARVCSSIIRALKRSGNLTHIPSGLSLLAGGNIQIEKTIIEQVEEAFETSWRNPGIAVDISGVPTVEDFKNTLEDLCYEFGFRRFSLFFDEAAHIFLPE